jgi:hypothetical protein
MSPKHINPGLKKYLIVFQTKGTWPTPPQQITSHPIRMLCHSIAYLCCKCFILICALYWRNRKRVHVLCAVIRHAEICQNTREVLRSMTQSGVLPNTFRVFWQIPKCFVTAQSTADKFSISFIKFKSLRGFAHAVGSYKACATANQIARNILVIL